MKRNSGFLILAILAALAVSCATESSVKVKVVIPGSPAVRLDPYREIVVAAFWQETELKDFNLNQALVSYLRDEIEHQFKGKLSSKTISWENAQMTENKDFWKQLLPEPQGCLILTGKAQFTQDVRKALLAKDRRAIDDGPFTPEKAWAARKSFSLKLGIYLIKPDTGEVLFQKDFQEAMDYEGQKQMAEFAFFDLLQKIKLKLFRLLFGSEKIQERYLLSR